MPSSEKRNLRNSLETTSIPADLPPAYENTILPNSNPWSDSASQTQPPQPTSSTPPSIPSQNPLAALSRLTTIPFSKYRIRDSKLSDDKTMLTTTNPELASGTASSSAALLQRKALLKFANEQIQLPPKPLMVIKGTHLGSMGQHGQPVVDFELKFNLTSMLDLEVYDAGEGGSGGRRGYATVKRYQPGSSNGSPKQLTREEMNMSPLELWLKKFCEDKAENRSFTIHRSTPNLPTSILEGHVRTLLAAAKYRGKLTVEFPLQYADVIVLRKSSNWFTNILRLYPTKKYEVVSVEWPVAGTSPSRDTEGHSEPDSSSRPPLQRTGTSNGITAEPESEQAAPPGSSASPSASNASNANPNHGDQTGVPALIAQEWWREWQFAIWNSVLAGKKGWVTLEDWIEAKMGVREKERAREWGVDYE